MKCRDRLSDLFWRWFLEDPSCPLCLEMREAEINRLYALVTTRIRTRMTFWESQLADAVTRKRAHRILNHLNRLQRLQRTCNARIEQLETE